jgi:hypothetical protein
VKGKRWGCRKLCVAGELADELEIADIPGEWGQPDIEDRTSAYPWSDLVNRPLFSIWRVMTASGYHHAG